MLKSTVTMKPLVISLLALPLLATVASADTQTTTTDTLVVVTPNPPVVVTQGAPTSVATPIQAPGMAEMPPAPPAPSNGAPQNENWSNVSHINGTPVKVGERGDYLYQFRKTNISGNPFLLFWSVYDIGVAHALTNNIAASVSITGHEGDFFQLTASLPIYFRRTYSGPFIEPGVLIRSYQSYSYDYYDSMSSWSSHVGPQLLLGWHWSFDSGLNLAIAVGPTKELGEDNNETSANGYLRVGYAF